MRPALGAERATYEALLQPSGPNQDFRAGVAIESTHSGLFKPNCPSNAKSTPVHTKFGSGPLQRSGWPKVVAALPMAFKTETKRSLWDADA